MIKKLNPFSINVSYEIFTKQFQSGLNEKESKKLFAFLNLATAERIFVYTVNTQKALPDLKKYPIAGIFTDYINLFTQEKSI